MAETDRLAGWLNDRGRQVAVAHGPTTYPIDPPFSPGPGLPEYPFGPAAVSTSPNPVYATVREGLRLLGLDRDRFGTPAWNPLGEIIRPGQTVVLKPNFVLEDRSMQPGRDGCMTTHGSVIRAVADYVYRALEGRGRIVVADAPADDAEVGAVFSEAGLPEIAAFYQQRARFNLEVADLRMSRIRRSRSIIIGHDALPGDPAGYAVVDLGKVSAFQEVQQSCDRLFGSEYDTKEIRQHHTGGRHEYYFSKTILGADCVILLPKLKTHKKVGITVNMKLLVGLNGNKNWVAHYRVGVPAEGGDACPGSGLKSRLEHRVAAAFRKVFPWLGPLRGVLARPIRCTGEALFGATDHVVRSGNWYGNDTAWRMTHDLMRILLYADADGRLGDRPVRQVFSVVDGIIGGEGNGPIDVTPRPTGVILMGSHPVAVDHVAARIMGFDAQKISLLRRLGDANPLPIMTFSPEAIEVRTEDRPTGAPLAELACVRPAFKPPSAWEGHIELGDAGE